MWLRLFWLFRWVWIYIASFVPISLEVGPQCIILCNTLWFWILSRLHARLIIWINIDRYPFFFLYDFESLILVVSTWLTQVCFLLFAPPTLSCSFYRGAGFTSNMIHENNKEWCRSGVGEYLSKVLNTSRKNFSVQCIKIFESHIKISLELGLEHNKRKQYLEDCLPEVYA